jgi:hypothetical protein
MTQPIVRVCSCSVPVSSIHALSSTPALSACLAGPRHVLSCCRACRAVVLPCCRAVVLSCRRAVVLPCCRAAMLPFAHDAALAHSHDPRLLPLRT